MSNDGTSNLPRKSTPKYIPVHDAPFSPEELVEIQCRLEDTDGGTIGCAAASRLLASLQHVERLLLAMVDSVARVDSMKRLGSLELARRYLTARGLLPAAPETRCAACNGVRCADAAPQSLGCIANYGRRRPETPLFVGDGEPGSAAEQIAGALNADPRVASLQAHLAEAQANGEDI